MLKDRLKEYFSFTKKERIGVLTLLVLIVLVFILPYFFSSPKNKNNNKEEFEKFKNEIAQLKTERKDSNRSVQKEENKNEEYAENYNEPYHKKEEKINGELFYFDPNTISTEDWKRLGLRDKTIHTIQNYLSKGGKFHKPEDLEKIYGLRENEYLRLMLYIKIENGYAKNKGEKTVSDNKRDFPEHKTKVFEEIDINEADTSKFISLPGIGSKLASRIVSFREKLGGFYAVEQISEIYNLPDSTFQKIKPYLKIENGHVKKININAADANTLKSHPYIKWNLANAIVQYRAQHGDYKSIDELKQIAIITPEIFQKISNYVETNNR
ncbi:MAG TPA: helix-hairpin-helix domain-containing protein [Puia sp.]|nr:helix-hairpin-helix domain-containing protein [Puia sp.]